MNQDLYWEVYKIKDPGEPIIWNKSIIKKKVSAILINSGNANVFTGPSGKKAILDILNKLSFCLDIPKIRFSLHLPE